MFFEFFGTYFSFHFLRALIAEELYVRKRPKKEYENKVKKMVKNAKKRGELTPQVKFEHLFAKFSFSWLWLTLDPFLDSIFFIFRCCKFWPCFKRMRMLNQVQKKFRQDLDLVNILNKIRDSHEILRNL